MFLLTVKLNWKSLEQTPQLNCTITRNIQNLIVPVYKKKATNLYELDFDNWISFVTNPETGPIFTRRFSRHQSRPAYSYSFFGCENTDAPFPLFFFRSLMPIIGGWILNRRRSTQKHSGIGKMSRMYLI